MLYSKKIIRAWGAICVRYPFFQTLHAYKKTSTVLSITYAAVLLVAVLWSYGIPQKQFGIADEIGVATNLFSTFIEISVIIAAGVGILFLKTISSAESIRIKDETENSLVPDSLIFAFPPKSAIEMRFNSSMHYAIPPILEACFRWSEFDREEFYLVEAGPLDLPKMSLISIGVNPDSSAVIFNLGTSSYYDIFFTHYSSDLVLSKQSAGERNDAGPITLRGLLGQSAAKFYQRQISEISAGRTFECLKILPNPLGISGIVLLSASGATYVLLRKRGSHEIAAKNKLEWSFAGLVEAFEWLHDSDVNINDFVRSELEDEIFSYFSCLRDLECSIDLLGLVVNPLYLYQPEIFATVQYDVDESCLSKVIDLSRHRFRVIDIRHLHSEFSGALTKNLCAPGLRLLERRHPGFFNLS